MKWISVCLLGLVSLSCVTPSSPPQTGNGRPELANPLTQAPPKDSEQILQTIAFGSCNRQDDQEQVHWDTILQNKPDLWIWSGDNVYADTHDPRQLAATYETQLANPAYQKFLTQVPVIGIWDDHDFADNNSGREAPQKEISQQLFLDFIGEPPQSERRERQGIYEAYTFGPPDHQVKIILLDTRYHREQPSARADILGVDQWHWLDMQLQASQAQVHILVSGIQIIPEEHPYETWAQFPLARQKLLNLLIRHQTPNPIIISGDRHLAEISQLAQTGRSHPRRLLEVTSSGLTHSYDDFSKEPNQHRIGKIFTGRNFGLIDIEWLPGNPQVSVRIQDLQNQTVLSYEP
jgi:alkaline phosphatase D